MPQSNLAKENLLIPAVPERESRNNAHSFPGFSNHTPLLSSYPTTVLQQIIEKLNALAVKAGILNDTLHY